MHILMTFPFSLGISGGGTYAFMQTARHLKAAGVDVSVMPLDSPGLKTLFRRAVPKMKEGRTQTKSLHDICVDVRHVPTSRFSFSLDAYFMQRAVANVVDRKKVNAIISWHHEGAFLGKICREHNIFFACRAAGNYELISKHPKGRIWSILAAGMIRRSFRHANSIWATSAFTRKEVIKVFKVDPQMVKVIPEGMNPIFHTAERNQPDAGSFGRFLFFGLWSRSKGLFDALTAFGQVASQGIGGWQFHIAGWGNELKVLQAIQENGIMEQVELLGKLDHPDLVKALEWAQIAILPSYIESFGLAVAEAHASGLPVIAYNTGAVSEMIVDDVTGWLVPLKRTDQLAQAILDSLKDPEKTFKMGLAGREKIAGCYSWPYTVQRMLADIEGN